MKMKKLLASAAAASLAVTSLASVASAKDAKEWSMIWNYGKYTWTAGTMDSAMDLSVEEYGTDVVVGDSYINKSIENVTWKTDDNTKSIDNFDAYIPVVFSTVYNDLLLDKGGTFSVTVEGQKMVNSNFKDISRTAQLIEVDGNTSGFEAYTNKKDYKFFILPLYEGECETGKLMLGDFDSIDKIIFNGSDGAKIETESDSQTLFAERTNYLTNEPWVKVMLDAIWEDGEFDSFTSHNYWTNLTMSYKALGTYAVTADSVKNGSLFKHTGVKIDAYVAKTSGNKTAEKINQCINELGSGIGFTLTAAEKKEATPILFDTDANGDGNLIRNEVVLLSKTDDYNSLNKDGATDSADQTYEEDFWDGTKPYQFAGLASQAADYFNKMTTGTITFEFKPATDAPKDEWLNGGIPSTEVGLREALEKADSDDFALWFNYATTTGTMLAGAKIDAKAGTVTFDISDYLDDCGGLTKATLNNIYYGNSSGFDLEVSKVIFEADDAAADVPSDDADDDAADLGDDDADDDDDATLDDDADDDATADDDADDDTDADDDSNVQGDNTVTDDDDDSNPPTGVALAVIPAMVAGAAAIVAKKRK